MNVSKLKNFRSWKIFKVNENQSWTFSKVKIIIYKKNQSNYKTESRHLKLQFNLIYNLELQESKTSSQIPPIPPKIPPEIPLFLGGAFGRK